MKKFLIAAFTLLLLPFVLAASQDVFLSSDVSLNLAPPEVIISEFITETKDMKDLPEYNDKYKYFYNNSISLIKQKFIKLGKSEDEWEEMSLYERAIYNLLYLAPKSALVAWTFQDIDDFLYATRGLGYYKDSLKRYPKSEEFGAALTKVWEWHWEYWVATGDIVNLMDFYSRGVENDSPETVINTDDTDTDKNIDNDVADDTQKTDTYDLAESEDETAETENGFITFLINHIFTIIVVIAAAVGFAYIYIFKIRRQKNG